MYINWEKKFETGIQKIDEQHKILIDIINELHENVIIKKDGSKVNELLMDLKIYTINHFSTEEKMLSRYKYPEEKSHAEEHKKFIDMVSENLFDVTSTRLEQGYRLMGFLKEWLIDHILKHDMEYVMFFKKQNNFLADIKNDIS